MIEVINRQRSRSMDEAHWARFAGRALAAIDRGAGLPDGDGANIVFVSDRAMGALNRRFRGRRGTTDVLSFPSERQDFEKDLAGGIGDVVISVERAAKQAAAHGLAFESEIAQLILHGLLHLRGYDHETDGGEMNRLELTLRRRLRI